MDLAELYAAAPRAIAGLLDLVPVTDEDLTTCTRACQEAQERQTNFLDAAEHVGIELTPGLWRLFITQIVEDWGDLAQDFAYGLPTLRSLYGEADDHAHRRLLDATAEALSEIAYAGFRGEAKRSDEVADRLVSLAAVINDLGDADRAYNITAIAGDLSPQVSAGRERVARYALSLAIDAERSHQVAFCSTDLACTIAQLAETAIERRIEAFEAVECAIEFLAKAEDPYRQIAAARLGTVISRYPYLKTLQIPLWLHLPDGLRPNRLAELLPVSRWPDRVSAKPRAIWFNALDTYLAIANWEFQIEKARFSLESKPKAATAHFDWVTARVLHSAYRRAVPHHKSFLRERNFDGQVLELSHELTHAVSFLGSIGMALIVLRVAALDVEMTIWSRHGVKGVDEMVSRVAKEGIAPLEGRDATLLFNVERALEITRKAQILQGVWTPWLEGLALFGESAADPALDEHGITLVSECLRGLVDFHPPIGERGKRPSREEVIEAFDAFAAEFDQRCSKAIHRLAPDRLLAAFRLHNDAPPYFAGYLGIRTIVAAWRQTTGIPLTGTQCFNLLLHATRYSSYEAIPDLSLQSDQFGAEAEKRMVSWIGALGRLDRTEIEAFIEPPERTGVGRHFEWSDGHVRPLSRDLSELDAYWSARFDRLVQQAVVSLMSNDSDDLRLGELDGEARTASQAVGKTVRKMFVKEYLDQKLIKTYQNFARRLLTLAGVLPIGTTESKFFLNVDPSHSHAYFGCHLRTTESHVDTGEPSVNGNLFPLEKEDGAAIAEVYARSGIPRISVTRVIDIAGQVRGEGYLAGLHFLAYRYGDWFNVFGATETVQDLLEQDARKYARLRRLINTRLEPSPVDRAELEVIATGRRRAETALAWLNGSAAWLLMDMPVPVESWAKKVQALAKAVLDPGLRWSHQRAIADSVLAQVLGDRSLASKLAGSGFQEFTADRPELRYELAKCLVETAMRPDMSNWLDELDACSFQAAGLFAKGTNRWDIRPSR